MDNINMNAVNCWDNNKEDRYEEQLNIYCNHNFHNTCKYLIFEPVPVQKKIEPIGKKLTYFLPKTKSLYMVDLPTCWIIP